MFWRCWLRCWNSVRHPADPKIFLLQNQQDYAIDRSRAGDNENDVLTTHSLNPAYLHLAPQEQKEGGWEGSSPEPMLTEPPSQRLQTPAAGQQNGDIKTSLFQEHCIFLSVIIGLSLNPGVRIHQHPAAHHDPNLHPLDPTAES